MRQMKIRELLKIIRSDGWYMVRQEGSHMQFHHLKKRETVTLSGHPNDDIHPKTLKSILKQAGMSD